MFDKLEDLLRRFEEIQNELSEPSVVSDQSRFRKLMKEQNDLTPIVETFQEYKKEKQNSMCFWRCCNAGLSCCNSDSDPGCIAVKCLFRSCNPDN